MEGFLFRKKKQQLGRETIHSPPSRAEVKNVWSITSTLHLSLCNSNAPYLHLGQLVEALSYKPEVAGSIPDGVIGIFH